MFQDGVEKSISRTSIRNRGSNTPLRSDTHSNACILHAPRHSVTHWPRIAFPITSPRGARAAQLSARRLPNLHLSHTPHHDARPDARTKCMVDAQDTERDQGVFANNTRPPPMHQPLIRTTPLSYWTSNIPSNAFHALFTPFSRFF